MSAAVRPCSAPGSPAAGRAQESPDARRLTLDCRGRPLDVGRGRAYVVGVLNVTPDSFSDGGRYRDVQAALDRAGQMAEEGATIVDVGGESTRPRGSVYGEGAAPVALDEELERVVPVVEAIARALPHVLVSVDTYKGVVAREALRAGAHMVNDVTALRKGVGTAAAAAEYGAPLVVMHAAGRPGALPHEPKAGACPPEAGASPSIEAGGDVVEAIIRSLRQSVRRAERAGVRDVVVDPGFGFGKTPTENLRLIAEVGRLAEALGRPVLVGVSRKSTVGVAVGSAERPAPVDERLFGSLGLAALAVIRGAAFVRVHDVRATADVLRVIAAAEASAETGGGR